MFPGICHSSAVVALSSAPKATLTMAVDASNIENRLFINGEFVPSASGRKFPLVNPITKAVTVDVFEAGVEDVDRAVASARDAFPHWSETDGET